MTDVMYHGDGAQPDLGFHPDEERPSSGFEIRRGVPERRASARGRLPGAGSCSARTSFGRSRAPALNGTHTVGAAWVAAVEAAAGRGDHIRYARRGIRPAHAAAGCCEFHGMTEACTIALVHAASDLVSDDGSQNAAHENRHCSIRSVSDGRSDRAADDPAEDRADCIAIAASGIDSVVLRPLLTAVAAAAFGMMVLVLVVTIPMAILLAVFRPPSMGRSMIRGIGVRRNTECRGGYHCDYSRDNSAKRFVDDPTHSSTSKTPRHLRHAGSGTADRDEGEYAT